MIRVLIADDHKVLSDGIIAVLSNDPEIEVVGSVINGAEVLKLLEGGLEVDQVIMDIEMKKMNGIEATVQVRRRFPKVKILVLSMHAPKHYITQLIQCGVSGYILKDKGAKELISAIKNVAKGQRHLGLEITDKLSGIPKKDTSFTNLTKMEKLVLCILAKEPGFTFQKIAESLNRKESTIHTHVKNIKRKLDRKTKAELLEYALTNRVCSNE